MLRRIRLAALIFALTLLANAGHTQTAQPVLSAADVKTPWTSELQPEWLQQVMPGADSFSDKAGSPPVFRAFRHEASGKQTLIGYVFLSADVPPEEKGYSKPLAMLIGLSVEGHLTGLKVLDYQESYRYSRGDFVADPAFLAQFPNKSISDEFRLRRDIDGLSGATMTSFGIARGAREAARRVATAYMDYQEGDAQELAWAANTRQELEQLSWQDLLETGIVRQLTIPLFTGDELELTLTYMGREVLGEYFIGSEAYARTERESSIRLGSREMMLLAVGGSGARMFRSQLLSIQQGDNPARRVQPNRFVTAGNADEGAIAGRANYAGAIVLEEGIDVTQPFTILYQPQGSVDPFSIDYALTGVGLALARNEPILSAEDIERARIAESNILVRLWYAPPWGDTPWLDVLLLLLTLTLVTAAFMRKDSRLRWAALTVTLFYLGFFKSGFLSVSHITGAISQGPGIFLGNLPMLLIVLFTLVTTLLWGRVFCSSLCPFGALQDFITRFSPKRWRLKVPQRIHDKALYIKYGVLTLIIGTALINSNLSIFQYFEPFGTLFFFSSSALLWTILIAILLACVAVERFYCRYLCPLGAALGLVSVLSPFKIKRVPQCSLCKVCEHACPTGAIRGPEIDFKECVRCDVCEIKLITKAGTCRHSMDEIARRFKQPLDRSTEGAKAAEGVAGREGERVPVVTIN